MTLLSFGRLGTGLLEKLRQHGVIVGAIAILVVAFLVFLSGQRTTAPLNRNEARFAQATKQMIESGDYIDIRFHNQKRYQKPIGIYWLQALAVAVSGEGAKAPIWVYRSVSLIGAVIATVLTYLLGVVLFGKKIGLLSGLFMISLFELGVEARSAKTDAVLLACVVIMQLGLALQVTRKNTNPPAFYQRFGFWLFWGGISFGILIKGPIVPLIGVITIGVMAIYGRDLSWFNGLKPLRGVLLVVAINLPWLIAINLVSSGQFYQASIGHDLFAKLLAYDEIFTSPPGLYSMVFIILAWPLAPFVVLGLPWIYNNRKVRGVAFCLAWFVPMWIIFELAPTKRPHYVLPLYPALALLASAAIFTEKKNLIGRWKSIAGFFIPLSPLLLIILVLLISVLFEGAMLWTGLILTTVVSAIGLFAWRLVLFDDLLRSALVAIFAGMMLQMAVFMFILPDVSTIWLAPRLAQSVDDNKPCFQPKLIASGYTAPHLLFALGTDLKFGDGKQSAEYLAKYPSCSMALVESQNEKLFLSRAGELGLSLYVVDRQNGYNLAKLGDGWQRVVVYSMTDQDNPDRDKVRH